MHFDQWNPLTNVIVENIAKFKKFKIGHNSKGMQYIGSNSLEKTYILFDLPYYWNS